MRFDRFDRGLGTTIAGPVVGFADDVRKITVGNIFEAIQGEDTKAASELISFAQTLATSAAVPRLLNFSFCGWLTVVVAKT